MKKKSEKKQYTYSNNVIELQTTKKATISVGRLTANYSRTK